MKIIDFEKKGNVIRFYLGADDCEKYGGDDWNDKPYEHNAGRVYDEYIVGYRDIAFPFEFAVLEPCDGCFNSAWCKDDMKARRVPCIVALETKDGWWEDDFDKLNANSKAVRFYFGDRMMPSKEFTAFTGKECL